MVGRWIANADTGEAAVGPNNFATQVLEGVELGRPLPRVDLRRARGRIVTARRRDGALHLGRHAERLPVRGHRRDHRSHDDGPPGCSSRL